MRSRQSDTPWKSIISSWSDGSIPAITSGLIRALIISPQPNTISSGLNPKDLSVTNHMNEYNELRMAAICGIEGDRH